MTSLPAHRRGEQRLAGPPWRRSAAGRPARRGGEPLPAGLTAVEASRGPPAARRGGEPLQAGRPARRRGEPLPACPPWRRAAARRGGEPLPARPPWRRAAAGRAARRRGEQRPASRSPWRRTAAGRPARRRGEPRPAGPPAVDASRLANRPVATSSARPGGVHLSTCMYGQGLLYAPTASRRIHGSLQCVSYSGHRVDSLDL